MAGHSLLFSFLLLRVRGVVRDGGGIVNKSCFIYFVGAHQHHQPTAAASARTRLVRAPSSTSVYVNEKRVKRTGFFRQNIKGLKGHTFSTNLLLFHKIKKRDFEKSVRNRNRKTSLHINPSNNPLSDHTGSLSVRGNHAHSGWGCVVNCGPSFRLFEMLL